MIDMKEKSCIAQHLKTYVEQCKNKTVSTFAEPCFGCNFNQNCDLNVWPTFEKLSKETGVLITPLLTKRDKDHLEIVKKSDNY